MYVIHSMSKFYAFCLFDFYCATLITNLKPDLHMPLIIHKKAGLNEFPCKMLLRNMCYSWSPVLDFLSSKVEARLSSPSASTGDPLFSAVLALAQVFRGQGKDLELMESRIVVHGQIFHFYGWLPAICLISTVLCIEM